MSINNIYDIKTNLDNTIDLNYSKIFNDNLTTNENIFLQNEEKTNYFLSFSLLKDYDNKEEKLESFQDKNKIIEHNSKKEDIKSLKNSKRKRRTKNNINSNLRKRVHSYLDNDNILRKIQVHYLSFIINFSNDVIRTFKDGYKDNNKIQFFRHLDYNSKKIVKHDYVESLKKKTIGEIVQFKATSKVKKSIDELINIKVYQDAIKNIPSIDKFFQKSYISLFKDYYCSENNQIEINGKIIQLSKKTKRFHDLIRKFHSYQERIKKVSNKYYLNCYKRYKRPKFKLYYK